MFLEVTISYSDFLKHAPGKKTIEMEPVARDAQVEALKQWVGI